MGLAIFRGALKHILYGLLGDHEKRLICETSIYATELAESHRGIVAGLIIAWVF